MRDWNLRAGRSRASALAGVVLLAVLQVLAVGHLIGHAATGDNGGCDVCVNAGHSGGALLPTVAVAPAFHARPVLRAFVPPSPTPVRPTPVYRSRAPPVSA